MGLLFKKLGRDLRQSKGQFFSVLLVVVIGVMFYTGFNSTLRNLKFASEKYFAEYRLADLWLYFHKIPESTVGQIAALPEIQKASGRLVRDARLNAPGRDAIIRMISLPDERAEVVNDIALKSGRYFSGGQANQCLMEEAFYKAHSLEIGGAIYPVINGNEVKLQIIGTVKSPEYVYPLRDNSEIVPNSNKFGIVYLRQSEAQNLFGFQGSFNEVAVLLNQKVDPVRFSDKLKRVYERHGLITTIQKKDQLSYNTFSSEINQLTTLGSVFPVMFFIVAAAIMYITMGRIVENQRTQIGTLKALGYSGGQIYGHYLSYAVLISVSGSILGAIAGDYFAQYMIGIYNQMYQLPLENMKSHPDLVIPAVLVALCFCILAGYNSCKHEMKLVPAESMRPKVPKAATRILLERWGSFWQRLSFSNKMIWRNIFRYKKRVALTLLGIVFSAALLLASIAMDGALRFLVDQQFNAVQRYDLKVNLSDYLNLEDLQYYRCLPHVVKAEPVLETGVELRNGWRKKEVGFIGLVDAPELYRVIDVGGLAHARTVTVPETGILIPAQLAATLGVSKGDVLHLKSFLAGKDRPEFRKPLIVRRVVSQYIGQAIYVNFKQLHYLFREGRFANAVVLKLDRTDSEAAVVKKIKELPGATSIQSRAESLRSLLKAIDAMAEMILLITIAAGSLAFAVIYNVTNINIYERYRELATLKVLGFTNQEMRRLIFNENVLITLAGMIFGLPLGRFLAEYMMAISSTDNMTLPVVISATNYGAAGLATLFFVVAANLILMGKIRTINMVEALKSSE